MTANCRQRWETKQLAKVHNHLRQCFRILTFTSDGDREEIEDKVMAKMQEEIASVPDYTIEHSSLPPSFESDADLMVMNILQEQELWRMIR
jgi:hypothetical protein